MWWKIINYRFNAHDFLYGVRNSKMFFFSTGVLSPKDFSEQMSESNSVSKPSFILSFISLISSTDHAICNTKGKEELIKLTADLEHIPDTRTRKISVCPEIILLDSGGKAT